MKIAPTLEGGLRIDIETPLDWMVLRCIPYDARGDTGTLAAKLGALMDGDPEAEDWRELIVPDLQTEFDTQLSTVESSLRQAGDDESPAELFIVKDEAERWYGALNQARLALQERYAFAETEPAAMSPGERSAWFRSQFYLHVQSLLLDYVMR